MSIAYLEPQAQPAIIEAQPVEPQDRNWFVVIQHNGVPRIALIEDWQFRYGNVYTKFRLMVSGETLWMEESNIICYIFPPNTLPQKPVNYRENDRVRLTTYEIATLIDVDGDLIVAETEAGEIKLLARWDVLRVLPRRVVA